MCNTVGPAAFIPMTCHRWLMVLITHDEDKLASHKKLTFGVAKVVLVSTLLFKDYVVNFTHFSQTCYQVYIHHIDNFSGSHSMSNTMNNKFGNFFTYYPWRRQTGQSQKVDFWGGQSCVGFNSIVQRLCGQFHSFFPDMLPGIYTSYWQFFRKPLNV